MRHAIENGKTNKQQKVFYRAVCRLVINFTCMTAWMDFIPTLEIMIIIMNEGKYRKLSQGKKKGLIEVDS